MESGSASTLKPLLNCIKRSCRHCKLGRLLLYSNHIYSLPLPITFKIAVARKRAMVKRARFDGDAFYAALDGERQARQCTLEARG